MTLQHSGFTNTQRSSGMPIERYRAVPADRPARPHLAEQPDHPGAAVALHRPPRRQPGPDRPDVARSASTGCSTCSSPWATRRSRSASRRASETDFSFVRQLIERDKVPEDVTISVLTQAREDLIERTTESLVGVHHANIHLYNALAPLFRRVVFRATNDEIKDIAVRGTEMVMKYSEANLSKTTIGYEYSPGDLHQHRAAVLARGVRGGLRRLAARRRPRDHPQPAGHRRVRDAQRVRRPDRVVLPPADPARVHHDQPAPAQRPRHRRRRHRAGHDGRRRPRRGLPVRPRRAHRQRRAW